MQQNGHRVYRQFWRQLFERFKDSASSFPTIISFNYDLVLERSLFQTVVGTDYKPHSARFPFDGINLKYHYNFVNDLRFKAKYVPFTVSRGDDFGREDGMILEATEETLRNPVDIEILKLHGSLNFPTKKNEVFFPTNVAKDPYILPPVINKWVGKNEEAVWSTGLQKLREAKNIIIVGYSLPTTDIFMQYFLKAGVGPNLNLNRIIVHNPALYRGGTENELMRERFANCFSPQLQSRIDFKPVEFSKPSLNGTFEGFVERLDNTDWFFGHYEQSNKSLIGF